MHVEISVALNFVISYLYNKLPRRRVDLLVEELESGLKKKFEGHWYPEKPNKGSGFRCIKVNGDDFVTIHHELGHNYYQRAYNKQSYLHLDGANDGFVCIFWLLALQK